MKESQRPHKDGGLFPWLGALLIAFLLAALLVGCGGNKAAAPAPSPSAKLKSAVGYSPVTCFTIIGGKGKDAHGKPIELTTSLTGHATCDSYALMMHQGVASLTFAGANYAHLRMPPFLVTPHKGVNVETETMSGATFWSAKNGVASRSANGMIHILSVVMDYQKVSAPKHR